MKRDRLRSPRERQALDALPGQAEAGASLRYGGRIIPAASGGGNAPYTSATDAIERDFGWTFFETFVYNPATFRAQYCRAMLGRAAGGADVFWCFCARHEAAPRSGTRNRLGVEAFCAFRLAPQERATGPHFRDWRLPAGVIPSFCLRVFRRPNRLMSESTTLSLLGDNMLKMTHLAALAAFVLVAIAATVGPDAQAQGQAAPSATPATPAAPARTRCAPPTPAAAGAPTATAPAAPGGGTTTTEMVDNPYGLQALWQGGDLVARITLAILVIMSVGSWYVIVTKVYEQAKMGGQARQAEKSFWRAPSVRKEREGLKKAARFASSPNPGWRRRARTPDCWATSTSTPGSACRSSARLTTCKAACRTGWPFWQPWARLRPSWDCSARSGASTTR